MSQSFLFLKDEGERGMGKNVRNFPIVLRGLLIQSMQSVWNLWERRFLQFKVRMYYSVLSCLAFNAFVVIIITFGAVVRYSLFCGKVMFWRRK